MAGFLVICGYLGNDERLKVAEERHWLRIRVLIIVMLVRFID